MNNIHPVDLQYNLHAYTSKKLFKKVEPKFSKMADFSGICCLILYFSVRAFITNVQLNFKKEIFDSV